MMMPTAPSRADRMREAAAGAGCRCSGGGDDGGGLGVEACTSEAMEEERRMDPGHRDGVPAAGGGDGDQCAL